MVKALLRGLTINHSKLVSVPGALISYRPPFWLAAGINTQRMAISLTVPWGHVDQPSAFLSEGIKKGFHMLRGAGLMDNPTAVLWTISSVPRTCFFHRFQRYPTAEQRCGGQLAVLHTRESKRCQMLTAQYPSSNDTIIVSFPMLNIQQQAPSCRRGSCWGSNNANFHHRVIVSPALWIPLGAVLLTAVTIQSQERGCWEKEMRPLMPTAGDRMHHTQRTETKCELLGPGKWTRGHMLRSQQKLASEMDKLYHEDVIGKRAGQNTENTTRDTSKLLCLNKIYPFSHVHSPVQRCSHTSILSQQQSCYQGSWCCTAWTPLASPPSPAASLPACSHWGSPPARAEPSLSVTLPLSKRAPAVHHSLTTQQTWPRVQRSCKNML